MWLIGGAVLAGVPLLLTAAIVLLLNTGVGRRETAVLTRRLTAGQVRLVGVHGRFPDAVRVDRAELRDTRGVWLAAAGIALDWSPWQLLVRTARVQALTIGSLTLDRLPVAAAPAKPLGGGFGLPVSVRADRLSIGRLVLGPAITGAAAVFSADGSARVPRFAAGRRPVGALDLTLRRTDAPGWYGLHAVLDRAGIVARLDAREPAGGTLVRAAGLPALGPLGLSASLEGAWAASVLRLQVAAGPLRAGAHGTLDLNAGAAALEVNATAPAMAPAPGLSWRSVAIGGRIDGAWRSPAATLNFEVSGLNAGGGSLGRLAGRLTADRKVARLTAQADDIRLAAPNQDLLAQGPLQLTARLLLDDPRRPLVLRLDHPTLTGSGEAVLLPAFSGKLTVAVPDLAAVARPRGRDVAGHAGFTLQVARHDAATRFDLDAAMAVTGGADAPAAARGATTLGATVTLDGGDITLSRLALDGTALHADARGLRRDGKVVADWALHATDLHQLASALRGTLDVVGHLAGTQREFAASAELSGALGTAAFAPAPLHLAVRGDGLPSRPSGHVEGEATLAGGELRLDADAVRQAGQSLLVTVNRADWKSAKVAASFVLAPGAALPVGRATVTMARLADLQSLLGRAVSGSLAGVVELPATGAGKVRLEARDAGLPGAGSVDRALLEARIADPTRQPAVAAKLSLHGLQAGAIGGEATVAADGKLNALALRLDAALHHVAGAEATLAAVGTLNTVARALTLASLRGTWHGETVVLAAPARLTLAPALGVDRLRLIASTSGAAPASLDLAGTARPGLALTVAARGITPALARPFAPDLLADGAIRLDATLGGTLAAPTGSVRLAATGLHVRTGTARALPPADLLAALTLAGRSGQLEATLSAASSRLGVSGQVPLGPGGALGLRANGTMALALLDPILTAEGRRVRGTLALDGSASGTLAAPDLAGTLRWMGGEVQDYAQGVHVTGIEAALTATGDTLRVDHFAGRAGGGTIALAGTIGVRAPMPVDLTLTADNARPVASDLVTATLDAALTLRGNLADRLTAAGRIHVRRADIQVPDQLPMSIAVLDVRLPGARAPSAAPSALQIPLDITLDAPQQVFVRGRGLDAELGGSLHLSGSSAAPQTAGAIELRRGAYSLAGQTLTFSSGDISFNGSRKIDPALNLIATSTNADITATLTVGGYASAPKITLSSVPDRPQDEILAALLFHQSATSLSPFQLAQIAAALAQVSGVTGSGPDPISRLRNGLGLDRLAVGTTGTGSSATTAVEAGRYVRPGVYVGAKQGVSGAQTAAEVQIDITRGLKLQTDVGSGPGGNDVGLTYQFQY